VSWSLLTRTRHHGPNLWLALQMCAGLPRSSSKQQSGFPFGDANCAAFPVWGAAQRRGAPRAWQAGAEDLSSVGRGGSACPPVSNCPLPTCPAESPSGWVAKVPKLQGVPLLPVTGFKPGERGAPEPAPGRLQCRQSGRGIAGFRVPAHSQPRELDRPEPSPGRLHCATRSTWNCGLPYRCPFASSVAAGCAPLRHHLSPFGWSGNSAVPNSKNGGGRASEGSTGRSHTRMVDTSR
jgi:hypothetical protein